MRRVSALFVPCAAYALSVLVFSISPILINVLTERQGLSKSQAGLVASAELLLTAAVGFLLAAICARLSHRHLLLIGSALLVAGNLMSVGAGSDIALIGARCVCGLGAGLVFVFANRLLAISDDPIQAFAFAQIAATVLGAALLFALPMLVALLGAPGMYGTLAALATAFAVKSVFEPVNAPRAPESTNVRRTVRTNAAARWNMAFGVVLLTVGMGIYWGFTELLGARVGASPEAIGLTLMVAYLGGAVTSAVSSWVSGRWGRWPPIALGFGIQTMCIVCACLSENASLVLASVVVQTLAVCFGIPYLFALCAEADADGDFASTGVAVFFFSLAAGPFLGGLIIQSAGYAGIAACAAITTIAGLASTFSVVRGLPKNPGNVKA